MSAEVEPGRVVGGRYRLIVRLGADPVGEVWRAHDERLRIDVAVKRFRLPAASAGADRAEVSGRAAQQARRAARLRDHPHVVAVYDVVVEDDVPWTVMQLVEGRSLREHLDVQGPLSVDRAADVARAVLKALAAAYTADIVHRDVTPAAVLLADGGEVLLTGFGIEAEGADSDLASVGVLVGTPGFVAPERIGGAEAGGKGDLFSLGVTLYLALEGELPFHPGIVTSVVHDEAAQPRRSGRLTGLITRLLEKDPELRPTPGQALALVEAPRDTVPSAPPERPVVERTAEAVVLEGHSSQVRAVAFGPDGTMLASAGDDRTVRLWDIRGGRTTRTTLTEHTDWIRTLAFSPDGSLLASGGDDKVVRLWDTGTGRPLTVLLTGHTGWVHTLAFSPDGTTLATGGGDKTVRLWDIASGGSTATLTGHTGRVRTLAFSPDGTTLATGGSDKTVRLWDVPSGKNLATWPGLGGRVHAVAFSPDGTTLATADGKSGVRMWNAATGELLPGRPGLDRRIRSLAFSPDGTRFATGATNRKVTLWDTATARAITTWTGAFGEAHSVVYSPDATMLASGDEKRVRLWYTPR